MAQQRDYRSASHGMTLVELLMVMSIMVILMAVALPMIRPAFQDRQRREASRQVNIFLTAAKARAAELGRPVGVWLDVEGLTGDERYASRMYVAEVAPGFTGSTVGARCTIDATVSPARLQFWQAWDPTVAQGADAITELILNQLIDPEIVPGQGERFFIRFDHKGPLFLCVNNMGVFNISVPAGVVPPGTEHPTSLPTAGDRPVGLPYEIIRSPSKSAVNPLTLPGDAVIDLNLSGVGVQTAAGSTANMFGTATVGGRIIIMFSPSGSTGAVYVDATEVAAAASVYLMIGRRANVIPTEQPPGTLNPNLTNPELSNLADPTNLWITINHRTGAITTDDNAVANPADLPATPTAFDYIKAAREFARGSRQKGGR